jgi:hypothetical protein
MERKQQTYFLFGIVWNETIYCHCFYRKVQETQEGLDLNRIHHHLMYADGTNLQGENIYPEKKKNMYLLWDVGKEVSLEVNMENSKYAFVSHQQNVGQEYY